MNKAAVIAAGLINLTIGVIDAIIAVGGFMEGRYILGTIASVASLYAFNVGFAALGILDKMVEHEESE